MKYLYCMSQHLSQLPWYNQKLCTFQDFHQASETMTSSFIHIMSLFLMLKSLDRAYLYKFAAKPKARGAKDY